MPIEKGSLLLQVASDNSTQTSVTSYDSVNQAICSLGTNIPTIITALGLALLGILIPLTIAILQDILQKRNTENGHNLAVLDLHVALDRVFRVKLLIICGLTIFVPFLLWDIENGLMRIIEVVIALIGLAFILKIIWDGYLWTKGSISSFRNEYLEKLEKKDDFVTVWNSIWSDRNLTPQQEHEYFGIFSQKIERIIENGRRNE